MSCNDRRVLRQYSSPDSINTDLLLDCPAEEKKKKKDRICNTWGNWQC